MLIVVAATVAATLLPTQDRVVEGTIHWRLNGFRGLADGIANILLFVPFRGSRSKIFQALAWVYLARAVLSFLIETAQPWVRSLHERARHRLQYSWNRSRCNYFQTDYSLASNARVRAEGISIIDTHSSEASGLPVPHTGRYMLRRCASRVVVLTPSTDLRCYREEDGSVGIERRADKVAALSHQSWCHFNNILVFKSA